MADSAVDGGRPSGLDLLLVVDNSSDMEALQVAFLGAFPRLADRLQAVDQPLSLHVGIVSSDLGAGQLQPSTCMLVGGDQGALQNRPGWTPGYPPDYCSRSQLATPEDRFLRWEMADDQVQKNFTGSLADAVGCYGAVGTGGCGFEHQLAAMRAALVGCDTRAGCLQLANTGFLRPEAALAVVILTDEDDCSAAADATLFDPRQNTLESELGPLTGYRCFEFGVLCQGLPVGREPGPREDCAPGSPDPDPLRQLIDPGQFVAFLRELKPGRERDVYVAVMAAPATPVAVGVDTYGCPRVLSSCSTVASFGNGQPAIRLEAFRRGFDADRGRMFSICADDEAGLESILDAIGADLASLAAR